MNKYDAIVPNIELADFRDLSVPVEEAFTWERGIDEVGPDGLYVVQFWSDRADTPPDVAQALLEHDQAAYGEAKEKFPDDFLRYYCDESLTNISKSMCLWTSLERARSALDLPAHREAVRFMRASRVYREYIVKGFRLQKVGEELSFDPVK